jgi:YVTN family beta-propeller protein
MRVTPVAALALLFAAACGSSNPRPEGEPTPGRNSRGPATFDSLRRNTVIENDRPDAPPRAGLLVVANQEGASATVVNAATLQTIATIPVGTGPHEVAVSPDGRWAVVSVYGDRGAPGNTLSVIDLSGATPAVSRTIDLGLYTRPHGVAFVLGGSKLAVTSETTQRLVIVDFMSGRVDTALATNGRGSHMVAVRRDLRRAWTGNIADGTVTEFDLDTRRTGRTYPAASMDEGIAATPGGVQVWVGSNDQHVVTVLDAAKGTRIDTIGGFGLPYRIGISRSSRVAVVNDPMKNRIWIYEVATRRLLAEIDLAKEQGIRTATGGQPGQEGAGPEGVAFDPIAEFAYVTLHGTNQVVAVDLNRLKVTGVGSVGAGPDGIAFSPLARR